MIYTTTGMVVTKIWGPGDTYEVVEVQVSGFERGDKVHVFVFSEDQKRPELIHGAPKELWDLETELSNVSAYAMGPILITHELLAQRVTEIKEKVRGMIREYGYDGPF